MKRLNDRAGNLYRKISRLLGVPEISRQRIVRFLDKAAGTIEPLRNDFPPASLAVVVPCYGHASFLPTALESIASQTRLPDEVIAVDDHSPDGSMSVLEEQFSRLREQEKIHCTLFSNDRNRGQAFSLNRAIAAAESELIMVLNDDDYLMHDAVATMLELFERYSDTVMVGGTSIHFRTNEDLGVHSRRCQSMGYAAPVVLTVRRPPDVVNYRHYNDLNMTHSGCCFLKSAWEKVGGYYPDKRKRLVPFSDRDFQLRVNAIFPVAISSAVPFSFWRSGSSVDQGKDS